jgi:adenine-specific DNA-methyltransferase
MARIEDLVGLVDDLSLRRELESAAAELKRQRRFGLAFEEHIPETTALLNFPVRADATVQRRDDTTGKDAYRVLDVQGDMVAIGSGTGDPRSCSIEVQ